jgi:23S rRNA pseudouridine1911/1915/1917 synthase
MVHVLIVPPDDEGVRLDVFVAHRLSPLSRSQAQRLITDAKVTINGKPARRSAHVAGGDTVNVTVPPPLPDTPLPEDLPISVLHDDTDVVVINKPSGLVVHPGAGHSRGTLVNALLFHVRGLSGIGGRARPGIVHRLDRGTSGVMVVAKHDAAHQALSKQFQDRTVRKIYTALVWGHPEIGRVFDRALGRDPKDRHKISSRARRTRTAYTRVEEAEPLESLSLVQLSIASGRTHQIRVHLSEAGYPVAGDTLYGGGRRKGSHPVLARLDRPFLHASTLSFRHPTDEREVTLHAPLPPNLLAIVDALRRSRDGKARGAATTAMTDHGPEGEY